MSNPKIIITDDGSYTLFSEDYGDIYHSRRGAWQESKYVFVEKGLKDYVRTRSMLPDNPLLILEIGFGTGLNALLSVIESAAIPLRIEYTTLEPFPVPVETAMKLNYPEIAGGDNWRKPFEELHVCPWNEPRQITEHFRLMKIMEPVQTRALANESFHIVYFDAFAPEKQPEMWTQDILEKLYDALKPGGVLVCYCSKSSFQRTLRACGFGIEKLPGPPGKREMVRAIKD